MLTAGGVERLQRWQDEGAMPPAVGRLGIAIERAEPNLTVTRMPVTAELLLPDGTASAALPAMVADVGMATSVVASLPEPRAVTTISMTIDHLAPPPASGSLVATCRARDFAGGEPQHAAGEVRDEEGRLVAAVSGWFLPGELERPGTRPPLPRERSAGDLTALLGVDASALTADRVGFPLAVRDALANSGGVLHGGIGAIGCVLAAEAALGPGTVLLTSSYAYLRPAPGRAVMGVSAEVLRRGRRTASAQALLTAPDGRTALRVDITAGVRP